MKRLLTVIILVITLVGCQQASNESVNIEENMIVEADVQEPDQIEFVDDNGNLQMIISANQKTVFTHDFDHYYNDAVDYLKQLIVNEDSVVFWDAINENVKVYGFIVLEGSYNLAMTEGFTVVQFEDINNDGILEMIGYSNERAADIFLYPYDIEVYSGLDYSVELTDDYLLSLLEERLKDYHDSPRYDTFESVLSMYVYTGKIDEGYRFIEEFTSSLEESSKYNKMYIEAFEKALKEASE